MNSKTDKIQKIAAVVFDLDGTLVSSNIDFSLLRKELNCPPDSDLLKHIETLPEEQQENATQLIIAHELIDAENSLPLQGCHSLLEFLSRQQLKTAIVTRNCRSAALAKLKQNDLGIGELLTREDYPAKPAPDALLALAKQWQIAPESIIYVGDYKYDLETANNANMIACLIHHNKPVPYQHLADLAFAELDQLEQFLKNQLLLSQIAKEAVA